MTISDTVPKTVNGGSVHSAAYKLVISELERLEQPLTDAGREEIVDAILALVRAGQRDPEQLARYAISKARSLR